MRSDLACAIAAAALLTGCAGQIPVPTEDNVRIASGQWPGISLAALERGRALYIGHCSGCHTLYRPTDLPFSRWAVTVTEMARHARLTDEEAQAVIRYLVTAAQRDGTSGRPAMFSSFGGGRTTE